MCLRSGHKAHHCHSSLPHSRHPSTPSAGAAVAAKSSINTSSQEYKPTADAPSRLSTTVVVRPALAKVAMEHGDPDLIPGVAHRRPEHVTVCVPHSTAVREDEQMLSLTALIGVQVNGRANLSVDIVRRDALQQLCILEHEMRVNCLTASTFLLHFSTPEHRTVTLHLGGLAAECTALRLMPWMCQVSASATKLMYRVRVCIEGVPEHAQ